MEKELNDFLNFVCTATDDQVFYVRLEELINEYKSINSVPEDKAPALVPNEGKEKECQAGMRYSDCHIHSDSISGCLDCGNYR